MTFAIQHGAALKKAIIGVRDFTTRAGYLQPIPARRFLKMTLPRTSFLKRVQMRPMASPEEHLDKFRWDRRVLRAGTTQQALSAAELATPQLSKEVLRANLIKASVKIDLEALEDNIERAGYMQTLLDGLAPRVGLDVEELQINGDTSNVVDPFLALQDGLLVDLNQQVYNHLGGSVGIPLWTNMIKSMPPEFQGELGNGALFFTHYNLQHDWRANLTGRVGPMGDAMLAAMGPVGAFGIPIEPVYNMPSNKTFGGISSYADVILMHPSNYVLGIYSGIRMFLSLDIEAGVWTVVVRMRLGGKIVEQTAGVKGRNVLAGADAVNIGGSSTTELVPDDPSPLSVLGFTGDEVDSVKGYADGITTFVPPSDLGIDAPVFFP